MRHQTTAALLLCAACTRGSDSASESARFAKVAREASQAEASAPRAAMAVPPPAKTGARHKAKSGPADSADSTIAVDFGESDSLGGPAGLGIASAGELKPPAAAEEPAAAQARSWFPETFLFEPLVVTDDAGAAVVPVRVPDRLTTWRVLALGWSRDGSQAGGTTSFLGTLPAYVDPVVPGFLMAGDEVRLPVTVVNTSDAELSRELRLSATGGSLSSPGAALRVPAHSSRVEYASLRAGRPGTLVVRATLGGADEVSRTVKVWPTGRYVEARRGGTLAAPREVQLEGPADLETESAKLRLLVYPGALALIRSELSAAGSRGGAAEDAYALSLAGEAPLLLRKLGDTPDDEAVRRLLLTATQRALRQGRRPSLQAAALIGKAALARPEDAVLQRLSQRLMEVVARAQRPDGTFAGADGWTLQRLLVTTAECLSALRAAAAAPTASPRDKQRALAAALRASGAVERNFGRVDDAYTAAALLAAGAAQGPLADKLRERVRAAVRTDEGGARSLPVEPGVQRADGSTPSEIDSTALAALALEGDPKAGWRADLGATLLSAWSPARGWGDGRTNLVALAAVVSLFHERLPEKIRIVLEMDGKPVREGELDARHVRDTLALDAPAPRAAGRHLYRVRAEPAVPGLGFSLTLQSWVPWKAEKGLAGLELSIALGKRAGAVTAKVGAAVEVRVEARLPGGLPARIRHALPAGAQPDAASLDALVSAGTLTAWHAEEGALLLEVPALAQGQAFHATYLVVPTLAGKLRSGPSSLALADRPEMAHVVPPQLWQIL